MTWDESPVIDLVSRGESFQATRLQVEIAADLARFEGSFTIWEAIELHERTMREVYLQDCKDRTQRWLDRQGKTGAEVNRERRAINRQVVIAKAVCAQCGSEFDIDRQRGLDGSTTVCSKACEVAIALAAKRAKAKRYEIDGSSLTLSEWCRRKSLSLFVVNNRLRRGWDIRRALGIAESPKKSSRYVGVSWNKGNHKWSAKLSYGDGSGRARHLGSFQTEYEAAAAIEAERAQSGAITKRTDRAMESLRMLFSERFGSNQSALARALGVTQAAVSYVLLGKGKPGHKMVDSVERILIETENVVSMDEWLRKKAACKAEAEPQKLRKCE